MQIIEFFDNLSIWSIANEYTHDGTLWEPQSIYFKDRLK